MSSVPSRAILRAPWWRLPRRWKRGVALTVWLGIAWLVHRSLPEPFTEAVSDLYRLAGTAIGPSEAGLLVPLATLAMTLGTVVVGLLLVRWTQR